MINFDITCIILTYNSYYNKGGCIEHTVLCLLNQLNVKLEIIIVDNSRIKSSYKKLKKFLSTINRKIKVIKIEDSIAAGRNIGAENANSNIIVFIDDDTLLLDNFGLEKILNNAKFFDYGYGATRYWTKDVMWFLTNKNRLKKDFKQNRFTFLYNNIGDPCPFIRRKLITKYLTRSFIGNFGFIKKDAFKKVGGFPEIFKGYGFEDDAFSFLCYINYGPPKSLAEIEIVHISHYTSEVCYNSLNHNKKLYQDFLKSYGYNAFHIGDLLYTENKLNRPILE